MKNVYLIALLKIILVFLLYPLNLYAEDKSPVTGALPDKISIRVGGGGSGYVFDSNRIYIEFCENNSLDKKYCYTPNRHLKISGSKTDALKIEPAIEGEWRFASDYSIAFTPKKPWQPGTKYTITFNKGLFPEQVDLTSKDYSFVSQNLYIASQKMTYLQDANDPSKKLVSTKLTFNYPIAKDSLENALNFKFEGQNKKLAFSFGFEEDNKTANITVPIEKLAPDSQFINLTINPSIKSFDNIGVLKANPHMKDNQFSDRVLIPSLYDYLKVENATSRVLKNKHYVPEQKIILESNAKIDSKEAAKFIELKLLPKDKETQGLAPKKDYTWESPSEITAELRSTLPKVDFSSADPDAEASLINEFNFIGEGGRYVLLTMKRGTPALGGYQLGRDYEAIIKIPSLPKEVKIMAEGAVLSLSGEKTVSLLSLGVSELEYKIGRVKEEDLSHLISQTRGNFSNPIFKNEYDFNQNNLSKIFSETKKLSVSDYKKPTYSSFDFTKYIEGGKGLFFLNVTGKYENTDNAKSKKTSLSYSSTESRFILVTDLGLIVKKNADGTRDIFVQSISENAPVKRVEIQVLGTNGEPVATAKTDGDGHATLPNLDGFINEKLPVAFVARKGDDISFLPYERNDRQLNYSKFDVNGITSTEGLKAYMFTDRGIYRPGETAHFGIIVKDKDWAKDLTGLPLILEVTNSRGQLIDKQILNLSHEGLIAADYITSETGATGIYNADIYLGKDENQKGLHLANVPLRIEEFLPDRMKMTSLFVQAGKPVEALAWVKPEQLEADVTLMQLYGSPAVNRKVTGKLNFAPGFFGFATYKDYNFTAGNMTDKSFEENLADKTTDEAGKANFALDLQKYKDSTFRLTFLGEGFEPDSGKSVKTSKSVLVSPLDYVLGVKEDGNLSYISPGDKRSISLIAVNQSLAKITASNVTSELKKVKSIQSLTKAGNGSYSYQYNDVETLLKSEAISVPVYGIKIDIPSESSGSYVLIYKNQAGVVLARVPFKVVGEANAAAGFTRDAKMDITLDKPAYKSGDNIKLNIESPYSGTGLITIETDKVHSWKWFNTDKTISTQSIEIPKDFEGKGFINVQFTRDLKSKEIFTSPLSFAVVPFVANIEERDAKIKLEIAKEVRPGSSVNVAYSSKQKGKIVIYAVDEGILLYGHYKNPDPLEHFLMKLGLEVSTSQIMDLLLPEYSILSSLSQVGGDGFANDGKNLNPFKRKTEPPVAYWSGILESDSQVRNWNFKVPTYFNGGVRIIAVSVSDATMGTNQTGLTVRGPLIVTPNLPLFAAPSDKFVATATIVNSLKGSGKDAKVKLAIEPSEQLQVIDAPKEELLIPEGKEITVPIKLQASDKLGSGELRLTASSGSEHFTISQTLSIRPPMPSTTILKSGFSKALSDTVKDLPVLYPELADIHAAVSSLPLAIIGGLRDYLVNYPYGCSEQLTSQTFPNVSLYGNSELIKAFGWNMQEMDTAIKHGFNQLRERQNYSGGFGMWSYYNDSNQFISNYVIHLLIEAKEKNLPVPEETLQNAIRNLKNTVNEAPHSIEEAREKAYGIYLLTRMGEITTNYIPHLTDYLDNYHRETWHSDLTAVYLASTYQLMQMENEANALLDKFELDKPVIYTNSFHDYSFYDSLTKYSQYVYLISKNFPKNLAKMDKAVIYRVANFVGEENYNTVSSAYAVMAIAAYVDASKDALANVTMSAVDMAGKPVDLSVIGERLKVANIKQPLATLTFNSTTPNFFYQIASNGYERKLPDKPIMQGLELSREYLDASGKPVTKVKIGDRIDVVMTLRSGSNKTLRNIAIVDLLPAGFELEPEAKKQEKVAKENNANSESESDEMPADTPSTGNPEESEDENTTTTSSDKLADWTPESVDRREDRIIIYGTFGTEVKKYHYRIKATAKGEFITPPYYAESMYDPKLKTRGLAGKIEVE